MGLLNQQPQGQPPVDPSQVDPSQADPTQGADSAPEEGGDSNVSPEEQQQYDTFVQKAAELIYGDGKVRPEILQSLAPAREPAKDPKGGNPAVLALANTAVQIVSKLDSSSKQAGFQVSDDVLYHGGSEVVEMLAEIAQHAGFHDYTEHEIQGAFFQAVDDYRPIAEEMGRTDQQTLKGQFQQVVDADQKGELNQLLPGIDQKGQGKQQPGGKSEGY